MRSMTRKRRFSLPALLLGAGAVGALIAAPDVMPLAHAESGRRLCVYKDENLNGNHLWSVVDYKKDGDPECPRLYSSEVASPGPDPKKVTCEDFAALLGKPSDPQSGLTPDPCTVLVNDHVYEITQDQGTRVYSSTDKGFYRNFQRSIRFHAYPGVTGVYRFCATTFDAQGKQLDSDCDSVGINGTSRLFYRPGTVKVTYHFGGRPLNTSTVIVASGDNDARNYCVDRRPTVTSAYTKEYFC